MKAIASIGAAIAVVGLSVSSVGALFGAYAVATQQWHYLGVLGVGLFVGLAGVTITYTAQVVQGGIDAYRLSREDEEEPDELTTARLSSMWAQEADTVRDLLNQMGITLDNDDDDR